MTKSRFVIFHIITNNYVLHDFLFCLKDFAIYDYNLRFSTPNVMDYQLDTCGGHQGRGTYAEIRLFVFSGEIVSKNLVDLIK